MKLLHVMVYCVPLVMHRPSLYTLSGELYQLPIPTAHSMEVMPTELPPPPGLVPPPGNQRSKSFSPSYKGKGYQRHFYSSPSPSRYHTSFSDQHRATLTGNSPSKKSRTSRKPMPPASPRTPQPRPPTRLENLEVVFVCHVKDPGEFYVQTNEQRAMVDQTQELLQKHCVDNYCPLKPEQLRPGEGVKGKREGPSEVGGFREGKGRG